MSSKNEAINNFIQGFGALGESLFIFHTSMVNAGFTSAEALELTKICLTDMLMQARRKAEENNDSA